MSEQDKVVSFFRYHRNLTPVSEMKPGDVAVLPSTGEFVIHGYNSDKFEESIEVDVFLSSEKNVGKYFTFATFAYSELHISISAEVDTIRSMFAKPGNFLMKKHPMDRLYEVIEPCTNTDTGGIEFYPLGRVTVSP